MKKYQLMAPGPTPVPSEVLLAMAQPILHHRTPEYETLFLEVRGRPRSDSCRPRRKSFRWRARGPGPWRPPSSARCRPATPSSS